MQAMRGSLRVLTCLPLLALCAAMPSQALSQNTTTRTTERERLTEAAREIMTISRYCALITVGANGQPQVRTMDPFPPEQNMIVWLATNPRSRKVAEIRRRPRVVLYYFDQPSQSYVTLTGTARLVTDASEKARHWKEEWKDFYPDRKKDFLLIAVTPEKLEIVSVKKGITGDSLKWNPPTVDFTKH